ncbi:MAG: diacylglycerol kinase family protein [Chloroflexota bacterium]|nr:diacylglycerol kinase family protein [Chloroflexota bacterium]
MSSEVFIIANPIAGDGKSGELSNKLVEALSRLQVSSTLKTALSAGESEELARLAIVEGSDVIVACGGDGTVHEIINGIKPCPGSKVSPLLAVLPAGRCNDFSTSLLLPDSPVELAAAIKSGHTKKIDLGKVGETFFATVATLGFDSEVAEYVDSGATPFFLSGILSYLYGLLIKLPKYQFPEVRIRTDSSMFRGSILLSAVGNTDRYGGGFLICPGAKIDDGLLHLCIVRQIPRLEVLKVLPKVFFGQHVSHPKVSLETFSNMSVALESTDKPENLSVWIWADGERAELLSAEEETTFKVIASAISVVVT